MMRSWLRLLIPPIILVILRRVQRSIQPNNSVPKTIFEENKNPRWYKIYGGKLAGRSLYLNPAIGYQTEILQGTYDQFLFDYIDRNNWNSKIVYDIGGHIGYHALNFAWRVGSEGHVFTFEPHPLHLERIRLNLSRNRDLAIRISLLELAASNITGESSFFLVDSVDLGDSSCSFIEGASTPFPRSYYAHYREVNVEVAKLDDLIGAGTCQPPDLIKIDVEGAESLVLKGAYETLDVYHPIIVMEIHSLPNMLNVATMLSSLNYSIILLKEEDRRCFVAAEPQV